MKNPLYTTAVTFARCNIPHYGHVELVQKMLEQAQTAEVYLSTGSKNTNWDVRVLTLRHLLREAGVDLRRVKTLAARSPFEAVELTLERGADAVVVLGEDQSALCEKLCGAYNLGGQLNRRTNSSTRIRHLLDHGDTDAVGRVYKNDPYSVSLVTMLRKEELAKKA
jgi:coenzyme F420-reducing hydrogenase delta subunit